VTTFPIERRTRWWSTELASTLFAAVPTFLTAIGGIVEGVRRSDPAAVRFGLAVLVAVGLGTTFKALQSRRKDLREAARRSPRDLEGALYVLHSAILAMRGLPDDDASTSKLRVTIFAVLAQDDVAVQAVPFVGGGDGHEGTRVSRRSGVVGRAILRGQPAVSIRDLPFERYVQTLVHEYAVPIEEARRVPEDRFAFLAVPFVEKRTGRITGVVYMDSPDRTFFSHPERPRAAVSDAFVARVARACAGLSAYAQLRYPEGSS
jgi:hypothetical protein